MGQIARGDEAVERRDEPGARELLVDQTNLRLRLTEEALILERIRPLLLAQSLIVFIKMLLSLGDPPQALQSEIAGVEGRQHCTFSDQVSGPSRCLADEAVEGRDDRPPHLALDLAGRGNTIFAGCEREEDHSCGYRDGGELAAQMAGPEEPPRLFRCGIDALDDDGAIVETLVEQRRSKD